MNYQRMIEILEAVKQLREDNKNRSPYVCDNLEEVVDVPVKDQTVILAIQDDIGRAIHHKFSIVEFLEVRDQCIYSHSDEVVINYRKQMIYTLITKYKVKIQETQT